MYAYFRPSSSSAIAVRQRDRERAANGSTYPEKGVYFGHGSICVDQVLGEVPRVVCEELHEIPCSSDLLADRLGLGQRSVDAPVKMDPDGGPGMLSSGERTIKLRRRRHAM